MPFANKILLSLLLFELVFAAGLHAAEKSHLANEVARRWFTNPPSWTVSGVFSLTDPEEFILVDIGSDSLERVALDGSNRGVVELPRELLAEPKLSPKVLHASGGRYFLNYGWSRFAVLDENWNLVLGPVHLHDQAIREDGTELASTFQWVPSGRGFEIVAVGDVKEDGVWKTRFVRVDLADPSKFREYPYLVSEELLDMYLVGYQFLSAGPAASTFFLAEEEGRAYVGILGAGMTVGTLESNWGESSSILHGQPLVDLSIKRGGAKTEEVYDYLSREFGSVKRLERVGSFLIALQRSSPNHWLMRVLDLKSLETVRELTFDSQAEDIVMIVGQSEIVLVEKGNVQEMRRQTIKTFILLPVGVVGK